MEFISRLEDAGELIRIKSFADPVLEIPEICDRVSKSGHGGKALLFTNTGTDFPVLMNSLGSARRMAMALGAKDLEDIPERLESLLNEFMISGGSFFRKLSLLPKLGAISGYFPSAYQGKPPCQEIIYKEPDLEILPVLKTWPFDGGRFITLPIVHTIDPESGNRNAGMYRMQVFNNNSTGMHWHRHKTGARHYELYKRMGLKMPVAVALGGDPVYTFAATAPLPDNLDEYIFAGFLREKSVKMVRCITQDIEVPADADIIIEGYVDPSEEKVTEGPFGDHTGFYSLEDKYPLFHVTCITHRKKAVYPATIVGIPPQEDAWIAKATERIFFMPIKKTICPELIDMDIPEQGVAHNLSVFKIEKSYPGQARKVMNALWGAGQMMFNKIMLVADESVDIWDKNMILEELLKIDPGRDILFSSGPLDVLDHSVEQTGYGGKIGIDLTKKTDEELSAVPLYIHRDKKIKKHLKEIEDYLIDERRYEPAGDKKGMVLFNIQKAENYKFPILCDTISSLEEYSGYSFFIFTDEQVDLKDPSEFIWYILNNIDPGRDVRFTSNIRGNSCVCIDGTSKTGFHDGFSRSWPNVIVMSDEIIEKVNSRWHEYGIGDFLESPSVKFKRLVRGDGAAVKN